MKRLIYSIYITLLCMVCFISFGCASERVSVSKPTSDIYVVDNADIIKQETEAKLLNIGKDLDQKYKAQLVVLTVNSLNGEDIESFSNRTFREWGIGDKEKNNGVLLVIAKNDHKDRIEVGYGLEGAIPDGKAGSILSDMNSSFKNKHFNSGIENAYLELSKLIYQEYGDAAAEDITQAQKEQSRQDMIIFIIIVVVIIVLVIIFGNGSSGHGSSGGFYSGGFSSSGSSSSSSFGGGSSGGGGVSGGW